MIKSEKAVSEVIGMVMILSIMVVVIGSIMIVGIPMIESSRDRGKMDVAANTFLSLQNDIEEVVRGPIWVRDPNNIALINGTGPSRETEFELMEGMLSSAPNSRNLTCTPDCNDITVDNPTITIPPSNITYTANNENIVYENGAVIRKYESGVPLMVSYPLINIYDDGVNNTVVSIHAISIKRTLFSVGGDGKAWIETGLVYYNQTINQTINSSRYVNQTKIILSSNYLDAWETFFRKKLEDDAGLKLSNNCPPPGTQGTYNINRGPSTTITVTIYGKNCTKPDIFLSVYESGLNMNVRG
jgi:hypothetical protein